MTGLLASVTSVDEAAIALKAGADIIDLKNPSSGALGALTADIQKEVVTFIAGRLPVSATIGDLPADAHQIHQAIEVTAATGVDYIKIGLFGEDYYASCIDALAQQAATGKQLIAVLFADLGPDYAGLIEQFARSGLTGVMLDTADKTNGRLRSHMSEAQLTDFTLKARNNGLISGLAGSLRSGDIAPLLKYEPDYLGFRTALCNQGVRTGEINREAIEAVRALMPSAQGSVRLTA